MAPDSIYGVLHRDCFELFPDAMFADLFTDVESARGARLVPIRRQAQGAYPDSTDHKSGPNGCRSDIPKRRPATNDGALCDARRPRRQRCSKKLSFLHR
jgi:hypothetical protein